MKKIFISIALMIAGCAIGQAQFSVKYDSEVQPKDNIQYFTPAGNNLFVGDCIPFYKDGVFYLYWLLDEGHCFRDQLVRFCQMEAVKLHQMAYRLGSMETFMRMVESGKGITFIPELAVYQLSESQKELVRPFAIPRPTRPIVLTTNKDFIRVSLLAVLKEEIRTAVPKEMLTLQAVQCLV